MVGYWRKNVVEQNEIKCTACERVWPIISTQGVVTQEWGSCYACFIAHIVKIRTELEEDSEDRVADCEHCQGLEPARLTCIPCGGKGWIIVPKAEWQDH